MTDKNQGLVFLRNVIRLCIKAEGAETIKAFEHGERYEWPATPEGVKEAAQLAEDIDGVVTYRIGRACLQALNDGPYDLDTRAEIVMDCNDRYSEITEGVN